MSKRSLLGRLVPCRCLRGEEEAVTSLDYSHCSLEALPKEVFSWEKSLQELLLDANQIEELPKQLFNCQLLERLSVPDNELTVLPSAIANLALLRELDVSKNSIQEFPENIKNCKVLTVVEASVNPITKLPDGFTQLLSLTQLYLNDAFLDFLPASFGRLTRLQILELRENQLKVLPKSMQKLVQLERLDLGSNEFTEVPEVMEQLSGLKELWMDGNRLTFLPGMLGELKQLVYLDVSKNNLEMIDDKISGCENLQDLLLSNNALTQLPGSIGSLKKLTALKVDENQLMYLPDSIGGLPLLEELDCSFNELESLPSSIGLCVNIRTFAADHNFLSTLPPEMGRCSSTTVLFLHSNKLEFLPDELGDMKALKVINLSNNRLKNLPFTFTKLSQMTAMWLSENQSKPLIPLQKEAEPESNKIVLTNYMFPQSPGAEEVVPSSDSDSFVPALWEEQRKQRAQVAFECDEDQDDRDTPPREGNLKRYPTPYPDELKSMVRTASRLRGAEPGNQPIKKQIGQQDVGLKVIEAPSANIVDANGVSSDANGVSSDSNGLPSDANGMVSDANGMASDASATLLDANGVLSEATDANGLTTVSETSDANGLTAVSDSSLYTQSVSESLSSHLLSLRSSDRAPINHQDTLEDSEDLSEEEEEEEEGMKVAELRPPLLDLSINSPKVVTLSKERTDDGKDADSLLDEAVANSNQNNSNCSSPSRMSDSVSMTTDSSQDASLCTPEREGEREGGTTLFPPHRLEDENMNTPRGPALLHNGNQSQQPSQTPPTQTPPPSRLDHLNMNVSVGAEPAMGQGQEPMSNGNPGEGAELETGPLSRSSEELRLPRRCPAPQLVAKAGSIGHMEPLAMATFPGHAHGGLGPVAGSQSIVRSKSANQLLGDAPLTVYAGSAPSRAPTHSGIGAPPPQYNIQYASSYQAPPPHSLANSNYSNRNQAPPYLPRGSAPFPAPPNHMTYRDFGSFARSHAPLSARTYSVDGPAPPRARPHNDFLQGRSQQPSRVQSEHSLLLDNQNAVRGVPPDWRDHVMRHLEHRKKDDVLAPPAYSLEPHRKVNGGVCVRPNSSSIARHPSREQLIDYLMLKVSQQPPGQAPPPRLLPPPPQQEIRVLLEKNPELGFSISGGVGGRGNPFRPDDDGIFVTRVQPEGPASNILQPGDKILQANGYSFINIDHSSAVSLLKTFINTVDLTVIRELQA